MEASPKKFDNGYFKLLLKGGGAFPSDRNLVLDPETKAIVTKFASSQDKFFAAFASACEYSSPHCEDHCHAIFRPCNASCSPISFYAFDSPVRPPPLSFFFFIIFSEALTTAHARAPLIIDIKMGLKGVKGV